MTNIVLYKAVWVSQPVCLQGTDKSTIIFPKIPGLIRRIVFSQPLTDRKAIPLAVACGIGCGDYRNALNQGALDLYLESASPWQAVHSFDEADLAVLSTNYDWSNSAHEFAERAASARLPCLMFDYGDRSTPASPPHGVVYRCSIDRSRQTERERAMPPICPNILPLSRPWQPRKKGQKPTVSFCGYVASLPRRYLYRALGYTDKIAGHDTRYRALQWLENSSLINTRFLRRNSYWGGALRFRNNSEKITQIREQYLGNLCEADYVVCVRGAGNFSYRFYEALSAGRIPLLIDTDCALPMEETLDWSRHCLRVPESDLSQIADRVAEHFRALSFDEFNEMQIANRKLLYEMLAPRPFLRYIIDYAIHDQF